MNTDALVLDYETPCAEPPAWSRSLAWTFRRAAALVRWALRNHHHVAGVVATAVAIRSIHLAWGAAFILGAPVSGGCGTGRVGARVDLQDAGTWLLTFPVLWAVARRSWWSVALARTSFAAAAGWWVYARLLTYGSHPPWYW